MTPLVPAMFVRQLRSLPGNFWCACLMELFERMAYVAVRAVAPLYLIRSAADNGLGLDFRQKGLIYTVWALIQCLVPMVSGAYTDRFGYRKSLFIAFTLIMLGYLGMAQSGPVGDTLGASAAGNMGFWIFLVAASLVAVGTGIFKPAIQGTIAGTATLKNSSVAWGTFYWVVNIGAALAPMCAAHLRSEVDWNHVFYAAMIITAVNFLPALFLFREPVRFTKHETAADRPSIVGVFVSSLRTIASDLRLIMLLLVFSCFWLMFMQLWDLLPNFIDEWVDSSDVAPLFSWFSRSWVSAAGQTKPEMIISINAVAIIVLVLPISWLIARTHKVRAMTIGMMLSLVGFVGSGATNVGWVCCVMVFVFALGEMACVPTFIAYMGLIAPEDKKALYMGYSNVPFAVGWAGGNAVGGILYEKLASKTVLARRYMVDQLDMDPAFVLNDALLPVDRVMTTLSTALGVDTASATQVLWHQFHPYAVWYYLGVFGTVSIAGMVAFHLMFKTDHAWR